MTLTKGLQPNIRYFRAPASTTRDESLHEGKNSSSAVQEFWQVTENAAAAQPHSTHLNDDINDKGRIGIGMGDTFWSYDATYIKSYSAARRTSDHVRRWGRKKKKINITECAQDASCSPEMINQELKKMLEMLFNCNYKNV